MKVCCTILHAAELGQDDRIKWGQIQESCNIYKSPFYSFEYVEAVASVHRGVRICRMTSNGHVIAYFPYQYTCRSHELLGIAQIVGAEMTDSCGILKVPGVLLNWGQLLSTSNIAYFWGTHIQNLEECDHSLVVQTDAGFSIDLSEGTDAFIKSLQLRKKKLWADTQRRERQLVREHGPLRYVFCDNTHEDELSRLILKKRQQYQRSRVPDPLSPIWRQELLRTLLGLRSNACQGVLSTLYAGDTWVASHFGLKGFNTLHYWFPVYNISLHRFSPGRLLLKATIEACEVHGVTQINRGQGIQEFKEEWANHTQNFYRLMWYRPNIWGLIGRVSMSLTWRSRFMRRHT